MSGKLRVIDLPLAVTAAFFLIAFATNQDLFRYPFIKSGRGLEGEKAAVVKTLRKYNKLYSDFQDSGGSPVLLDEFPGSKAIRHDIFRDIGFLRDAGRVQIYDLADLVPVDVKITSFMTAEAVVLEQWNYLYQRLSDRKPISNPKGLGRGFRYYLVRQNNRWMVTAWEPEQVQEPAITEFRF